MQSKNFEIILNILIGIRRSLGNLIEGIPSTRLKPWQFERVFCMESDWVSTSAQRPSLF
jgi:hypothetical protein